MSCACRHPDKPRVTLVDGREACTWCEDYRHECEARHVLALQPLAARRAYLYGTLNRWNKPAGGIEQRRGLEAVRRLEATMTALWERRKAEAKDAVVSGRLRQELNAQMTYKTDTSSLFK